MKYLPCLLFLGLIISLSCNNEPEKSGEITTIDSAKPVENKIMIPNSICYSSVRAKDTVFLKVEKFPNVVTGKLSYQLYEKDDNKGKIDGIMKGDTLIANYTFMSEGKSSIRQVAFIIKDDTATEGYGPTEEKEGKIVFKSINALAFGKGIQLKKIPCGEK